MKKISFILMLVLIVTSCDKFYEEDLSTLITAESGALTSEQGLFAALSGAYKPMAQVWSQGIGKCLHCCHPYGRRRPYNPQSK